jgi:hypothetical protein
MADGRKGARPKPKAVPLEVFDSNFDSIFGQPKERKQVVLDVPPPAKEEKKSKLTFNTVPPPEQN